MKLKEFVYNEKPRQILEMKSSETYVEGIEVTTMSDDERKDFEDIMSKLDPYIKKFYRKYFIEKMIEQQHYPKELE